LLAPLLAGNDAAKTEKRNPYCTEQALARRVCRRADDKLTNQRRYRKQA